MSEYSHMNQAVEAALNSLEGMTKASPEPYFQTRLMARMERAQRGAWAIAFDLLSRPSVAMGFAFSLLLINGYILFSTVSDSSESVDEPPMAVVSEYGAQPVLFYESNPDLP